MAKVPIGSQITIHIKVSHLLKYLKEVTFSKSSGKHTELTKGKMANQYTRTSTEVREVPTNRPKPGKDFSTNPVTCYNRYAVFHQGDGVVSQITDTKALDPNLHKNLDEKTGQTMSSVNPDNESKRASHNDASAELKQNVCAKVKLQKKNLNPIPVDSDMNSTSKYDLPLHLRDKQIDYTNIMASCPTLQLWDKQNSLKVGFIPMGDLELPPAVLPSVSNADPLTLHQIIKASGKYNFNQCQINIKSQLNPDAWDRLLQGYWDSQLPLLIRFGFPLDFDRNIPLESHLENHNSAKNYPNDVRAYLEEEKSYNAIVGPFDAPPLANLHTSPFMTRDKPHSKNRRVIVDLSFPQGKSVNACSAQDVYLNTPFVLKLPTIDHVKPVKSLGKGCMIYKIDIKHAFRHVKLDPKDYDLLGLCQDGWFLDTCLPFRFRHGSALF